MNSNQKAFFIAGLLVLSACATASDPASSWSRSYLAPQDKVIDAVVDVLEEENYLVDVNRAAGRINAEPSRTGAGGRANLVVRVEPRKGRMAVDVQARSGAQFSERAGNPAEAQVLEFLHELDRRLQGNRE